MKELKFLSDKQRSKLLEFIRIFTKYSTENAKQFLFLFDYDTKAALEEVGLEGALRVKSREEALVVREEIAERYRLANGNTSFGTEMYYVLYANNSRFMATIKLFRERYVSEYAICYLIDRIEYNKAIKVGGPILNEKQKSYFEKRGANINFLISDLTMPEKKDEKDFKKVQKIDILLSRGTFKEAIELKRKEEELKSELERVARRLNNLKKELEEKRINFDKLDFNFVESVLAELSQIPE